MNTVYLLECVETENRKHWWIVGIFPGNSDGYNDAKCLACHRHKPEWEHIVYEIPLGINITNSKTGLDQMSWCQHYHLNQDGSLRAFSVNPGNADEEA